jgi:transposase-like protein
MRNILDKVPDKVRDEVHFRLSQLYNARSYQEALGLKRDFVRRYSKDYPKAVQSLEEAGDSLFTYSKFPYQHWKSIKSTNVIESMFSSVKLRTDAARRIPKRESALYLVFKLLVSRQHRLNKIHGHRLVAQTIDRLRIETTPKMRIAA